MSKKDLDRLWFCFRESASTGMDRRGREVISSRGNEGRTGGCSEVAERERGQVGCRDFTSFLECFFRRSISPLEWMENV
jgi:hypothetical protein